jgi:putative membrane protein
MQSQKHTMSKMAAVAGLVLATAVPSLLAQISDTSTTAQRGVLSPRDYRFFDKAAQGGIEEVQLGELAKEKGVSQSVRDFGNRMIADHGKANKELTQLGTQKGAAMPTQLAHHERSTLEDLQKTSGADFDKDYAKAMVKDHRKDVKEFESAIKDVKDPEVRAWAQKTLPILQEHLRMAEQMQESVKNEK